MFNIIKRRKIWYSFSGLLILLSLLSLLFWGLNFGIDFTGGSLTELEFKNERPSNQQIQEALIDLELPNILIQPTGEKGILIRTVSLTEEKHQQLLKNIELIDENSTITDEPQTREVPVSAADLGITGEGTEDLQITATVPVEEGQLIYGSFEELKFDSIGPVIGQELKTKSIYAIIIVLLAIILYIAYAFRKVSHPVESWKYGACAIIALTHDLIIITGIFAVLGHFLNVQVDSYFVTALLTILGFSVHDTIVTFDRTRENLKRHQDKTFEDVVNISVNDTIIRSLNTSLTTIFVLISIFLFGGETVKYFVLALMLGVIIGTYSSIFLASPLLMFWYKVKKY